MIHAMSCLTIAAQCTLGKGGTWDGILANLKNGWTPVCLFDDNSKSATELQNRGVHLITTENMKDLSLLATQFQNFLD